MTTLFKTIFVYCFFISSSNWIPVAQSQYPVVSPQTSTSFTANDVATLQYQLAAQSKLSTDLLNANAALQSAIADLQATVASLQSRLTAQSSSSESSIAALQSRMAAQSNSMDNVAAALLSNVAQLKSQIAAQFNASSSDVAAVKNQLTSVLQSPMMTMYMGKAVAGPMPTGCNDVQALGWTLNGFYTVKGRVNKVSTVYCDFTKPQGEIGFESVIGFNDVKTNSTGVYFEVARKTSYTGSQSTVIPWEVEKLNIGGAMNLTTGVFTVPTNGRYQLSFIGRAVNANENYVTIRVNKADIGMAYGSGSTSMTFLTIVNLKKNDKVDAFMTQGSLFDNFIGFNRFTGILLEEDLSL